LRVTPGASGRALAGAVAVALLAGCATIAPTPPVAPAPPAAPAPVPPPTLPPLLRLDAVPFAELEGWPQGDPRGALRAFLRSCAVLAAKPDDAPLGGVNYAGTAVEWRQACGAGALASSDDPDAAIFATNASPPPRGVGCSADCVGKSVDAVVPAR